MNGLRRVTVPLRVQPDEGMHLHMTVKEPGPGGIRLRPVSLDLSYATAFDAVSPDAYERLLLDVIKGNPTLFMPQSGLRMLAEELISGRRGYFDHHLVAAQEG